MFALALRTVLNPREVSVNVPREPVQDLPVIEVSA